MESASSLGFKVSNEINNVSCHTFHAKGAEKNKILFFFKSLFITFIFKFFKHIKYAKWIWNNKEWNKKEKKEVKY